MTPLWKKLNLKDQSAIAVVNAPDSFESEIAALESVTVTRSLTKAATTSFFIVFATKAVGKWAVRRRTWDVGRRT